MNGGIRGRLGVVTIGQAPRDDMVPEMRRWLAGIDVVEAGALDLLDRTEIAALSPGPDDADVLITRLGDGTAVNVAHRHIVPLVQDAVRRLEREREVAGTLVVCTGQFPPFDHDRPLLLAERLLVHGVAGICGTEESVGIVCPLPEQLQTSREKWSLLGGPVEVATASPYVQDATSGVAHAARAVAGRGAGYVVLDCMGYTQRMREAAVDAACVPVLLSRAVVARLAGEAVT